MDRIKVVNSSVFPLNGTNGRYVHLASMHKGLREYMCFIDKRLQRVFIEQISGGHLEFIEDQQLAEELAAFLQERGLLSMSRIASLTTHAV